jgi:hypothetical protein
MDALLAHSPVHVAAAHDDAAAPAAPARGHMPAPMDLQDLQGVVRNLGNAFAAMGAAVQHDPNAVADALANLIF